MYSSIPRRTPILNMQKKSKNIRMLKKTIGELKLLGKHLKNGNGILKARNASYRNILKNCPKRNKKLFKYATK
jgi:hypothetical protein